MEERYALELIQKNKRIDDRSFDQYREIKIKQGVIKSAEGSADVSIGNTRVIAGVKMDLDEPFPDTPEEGILIVNAEFNPLASPDFESGPPGENAIELARIVDRGLRESKCIELEKLCITPKEKVWCVFVDIDIIDHDGNLLDCAALAAIAALLDTKMPKIEDDEIIREDLENPLPIKYKPVNITVCKIGDKILLDPNLKEERVVDSKLSIAVRDDDKICALQKMGGKLRVDDIKTMVTMAIKKSKDIRKMVK